MSLQSLSRTREKSDTRLVLSPQALYSDFGDAGASFRDDDTGVAGGGFFEGIGLQGVVDPAGPASDVFMLLLVALPMCVLYEASIWLVGRTTGQ